MSTSYTSSPPSATMACSGIDFFLQIGKNFSPTFSPLRYWVSVLQPEHGALVDESGMIRTQRGTKQIIEWSQFEWDALYDTTP
jgi:hypothetical protein